MVIPMHAGEDLKPGLLSDMIKDAGLTRVGFHISNALRKLGVAPRVEAVVWAKERDPAI